MRGFAISLLGLVTLAGSASMVPAYARRTDPRPSLPALDLTVDLWREGAQLVEARLSEIPVDPAGLQPVQFDPRLPAGARELIAGVYDARGRLLAAYGWPARGLEFHDEVRGDGRGVLRGKISYPAANQRVVRVPLSRDAAHVVLLTAAVEPGTGDGRPDCERLDGAVQCLVALVSVGKGGGTPRRQGRPAAPPKAFEPPARGLSGVRPDRSGKWAGVEAPPPESRIAANCPYHDGYVESVTRLHGSGPTDRQFDVVIMGDGFAVGELTLLDAWADRVKNALLSTEPFSSLTNRISIHLARTVSTESNVTHCPDPVTRRTLFRVEGEWTSEDGERGGPGYFGTYAHCRIRDTVMQVGLPATIELIVMIVHCDVYGGKAEPEQKLVFVPTVTDDDTFEKLVLHEAGHSIARLGEEYVACAGFDPLRTYPTYFPNIVPDAQSSAAWWTSLLRPEERGANGGFLAVHKCGDPEDDSAGQCIPLPTAGQNDMLGLFWGAQYGTATGLANTCNAYCGEFGGNVIGTADCGFYRPMARCKMRRLQWPYCRACAQKIRDRIVFAAP